MQRFFQKILHIRPEELRKSLTFLRLIILWSLGTNLFETIADGLFLEKMGSKNLPFIFTLTALTMIATSFLVLYGIRFKNPCKILTTTLGLATILCLGAAIFLFFSQSVWFWSILKIFSKVFSAILFASIWTFIDQYHDFQNAKRVYALYNAIYYAGCIFAGTLINIAFDYLHTSGILIISAIAVLLTLFEVKKISHTPPLHDSPENVPDFRKDEDLPPIEEGVLQAAKKEPLSLQTLFQSMIRSPFTMMLLLLSLITQLLMIVSEYSYMDYFARHFETLHRTTQCEGAIAEFLGKCRAWISGCSLFFGVFLYGRFIHKIGLHNVMMVSPVIFFLLYTEWFFYDALFIAIFGLIAVEGVRYTIEDNCFNLLSKAAPENLRPKIRIINDSFFEPIGILFGSLLLWGMQAGNLMIGLVLSIIGLVTALALRGLYYKTALYPTTTKR